MLTRARGSISQVNHNNRRTPIEEHRTSKTPHNTCFSCRRPSPIGTKAMDSALKRCRLEAQNGSASRAHAMRVGSGKVRLASAHVFHCHPTDKLHYQ